MLICIWRRCELGYGMPDKGHLNGKQECQIMPARAEIANSADRTARRGIIETILAFLDSVARTNARNKNNEPFGL
jgi:hypothetical protein